MPDSKVAAAAGGVMLVKREDARCTRWIGCHQVRADRRLRARETDQAWCGSIIRQDELTLTNDIRSLRDYPNLNEIWRMITRTAFTQLHYSPWLLGGTVIGMGVLFLAPLLLLLIAMLSRSRPGC